MRTGYACSGARSRRKIDAVEPLRSRLPLMDVLGRLTVDPSVRFGKPCVRGTRIAAGDVLGYLAAGMSADEILQDFPQLVRDDIRACLVYAAERGLARLPGP